MLTLFQFIYNEVKFYCIHHNATMLIFFIGIAIHLLQSPPITLILANYHTHSHYLSHSHSLLITLALTTYSTCTFYLSHSPPIALTLAPHCICTHCVPNNCTRGNSHYTFERLQNWSTNSG